MAWGQGGSSLQITRLAIVSVAFPATWTVLYTPFFITGLLLERQWPSLGPLFWVFLAVSVIVPFWGAFYACRLMWPKYESK
jgi:hypothetical protein